MENRHFEGAPTRRFQVELGQVIDLPLEAGDEDNATRKATGPALALHITPKLMQRLRESPRIRTLLTAVDAQGLPVPLVVLVFGRDAVLAILEPGDARVAALMAAAAMRGWLPVVLQNENRGAVIAVDWPVNGGTLLSAVTSAPPPNAAQFVQALAIALDAVPSLLEPLPASERPLRVAHHLVASDARLLMLLKAAQAVLAEAAALRSTVTVH